MKKHYEISSVEIKSVLRKKFLSLRKRFSRNSPKEKHRVDRTICLRLQEFLFQFDYRNIMLYYPHAGEVSLLELLPELLSNKTVLFPRVVSDRDIEAIRVESGKDFLPGYRGIREPQGERYLGVIDVVLVPGIVFSVIDKGNGVRRLGRIGYGGGYYDRFLRQQSSAYKVGVYYEFQKSEEDFSQPHDIDLNMIVTEKSIAYETFF